MSRKSSRGRCGAIVCAGRTIGVMLVTSARSYAVTQGRASSVPWRKRILLGVVVVVVAALMTISRHVVLLVLGWLLPLPWI